MKEKKEYIAPRLQAVTFKAEKGYAGSLTALAMDIEDQQMEDYTCHDTWTSGSNHFWD